MPIVFALRTIAEFVRDLQLSEQVMHLHMLFSKFAVAKQEQPLALEF